MVKIRDFGLYVRDREIIVCTTYFVTYSAIEMIGDDKTATYLSMYDGDEYRTPEFLTGIKIGYCTDVWAAGYGNNGILFIIFYLTIARNLD